jgi:hypothetical protein
VTVRSAARQSSPLFVLGSPRSFSSIVCAMLGEHPRLYGFPEVNLFVSDTLGDLWERMSGARQIQLHGLLRLVSHLYAGEQSIDALEMARHWVARRFDASTTDIYHELVEKIAPLRAVDKSPVYTESRSYLDRITAAFPNARYLHLVRHPQTQGVSMMNIAGGAMVLLGQSMDTDVDPPVPDPQIAWLRGQRTIMEFLESLPRERWIRARGEDLLSSPREHLEAICDWMDLEHDEAAMTRMLHPERSPFACLGPPGAHLGNDINFLRSPELRPVHIKAASLEGPMPWRSDGLGLKPPVVELAHTLGYR